MSRHAHLETLAAEESQKNFSVLGCLLSFRLLALCPVLAPFAY